MALQLGFRGHAGQYSLLTGQSREGNRCAFVYSYLRSGVGARKSKRYLCCG